MIYYTEYIASPTATILPARRLIEECKNRDIITILDGAHTPGQIKLDIEDMDPDFYIGEQLLDKVIPVLNPNFPHKKPSLWKGPPGGTSRRQCLWIPLGGIPYPLQCLTLRTLWDQKIISECFYCDLGISS